MFTSPVEAILPEPVGTHATISAELLARCRRHHFRVVEVGVRHSPRGAGEQSGARLDVISGPLACFTWSARISDDPSIAMQPRATQPQA